MRNVLVAALCVTAFTLTTHAADEVAKAEYLWAKSPHGRMLERTLPRSVEPHTLPEPSSDGARLTVRYCVQCHYLPAPHMHTAKRWTSVVERMNWRMQGKGNMGTLMKDMMAGVAAPTAEELTTLIGYLQKHAQREIDPAHPALKSEEGQMFTIACSQCHAPPDPKRHSAREWPSVVARMQRHMAWTNRVVGDASLRTNPELKTDEIIKWLQRYAK
jgi:hypothetical protein